MAVVRMNVIKEIETLEDSFLFYVLRQKHPLIRTGVGIAFLASQERWDTIVPQDSALSPLLCITGRKVRD